MSGGPDPEPRRRASVRAVLARGWRRRCPRCGEGPLFRSWFTLHESCEACGYRFERDPGETWGFWVFLDRVFLLVPLALLAVGFRTTSWPVLALLFLGMVVPLVATMPRRWGVCIALDYLVRTWSGEQGTSSGS